MLAGIGAEVMKGSDLMCLGGETMKKNNMESGADERKQIGSSK